MSVVKVRNLNKKYHSFELSNVSFDIGSGRIAGFIGKNGSGKTTTIKAMLNLIHIDVGEVSYFDKLLIDDESEIKKYIVYISEGNIVAAMSREEFIDNFSMDNESLEKTIVRMERSVANA